MATRCRATRKYAQLSWAALASGVSLCGCATALSDGTIDELDSGDGSDSGGDVDSMGGAMDGVGGNSTLATGGSATGSGGAVSSGGIPGAGGFTTAGGSSSGGAASSGGAGGWDPTVILVDDVSMNGCASTPPVGFPFGFDASAEGWLMGGAPGRVATALAYAAGQGFSGGALQLTISHQMSGDFGQATFAFPSPQFDLLDCTISARVRVVSGPECGVEGLLFTWESSASITVPDVSATPAVSLGSDWTTIQFGPVTPGAPADSLSLNVIACDDGL